MIKNTTDSASAQLTESWDRKAVTKACERLRAIAESAQWKGNCKTDWAILLTALDRAQYMGHLDMYLDARSMSFAAGVAPTTASHGLFRLCRDKWFISHPGNALAPKDRIPVTLANRYHLNPDYPRVYRYCRFPIRAYGGKAGLGEWLSTPEESGTLIYLLMRDGRTYTHAGTREALLTARTEVGVLLGKSAVWVAVKLTDEPRTIKDIAMAAKVDPSTAGKVLRHKLAPRGLAVCAEGEAVSSKGKWIAGMPLDEYRLDESVNPFRVKARLEQIAKDRKEFYREHEKRLQAWRARWELENA